MIRQRKTGQTALEYVILIIIVLGALLAIQVYMKRGMQGRWKETIDDMGDQYDPRTAITNVRHTITSSTNTSIMVYNTDGGFWTRRTDVSTSQENKVGDTSVGSY